jgi:hypothetical protein
MIHNNVQRETSVLYTSFCVSDIYIFMADLDSRNVS